MKESEQRNFGEQPLVQILDKQGVQLKELVQRSDEQLTFKLLQRACKGRKLTQRSKKKVLRAINKYTGKEYQFSDLFNY